VLSLRFFKFALINNLFLKSLEIASLFEKLGTIPESGAGSLLILKIKYSSSKLSNPSMRFTGIFYSKLSASAPVGGESKKF
jgi:hypothetical protein